MSAALLEVQDLHISFDGIRVLDGLSLSLEAGELRFLIGPNGAGKTTLLDVVSAKPRPATATAAWTCFCRPALASVSVSPRCWTLRGLGHRLIRRPACCRMVSNN